MAPRLVERTYPGKPMGLDYLASVLQEEGWAVEIIDVDLVGLDDYLALLKKNAFDLIGMTAMSIQVDECNTLARWTRVLSPSSVLIRGGAHDTFAYSQSCETHRDLYDAYIVGEGEETLREVARTVLCGDFHDRRKKIAGLAYWDGEARFTGRRHPADVNEHLPLRLFHHPSYDFDVFDRRKTAQVLAARGCENACFYCSEAVSVHGRREFRRSPQNLKVELLALKNERYESVYFDDPTFTRDRDWVLAVCDELKNVGFTWGCNTRVDCLDDDLVDRMSASGCKYLFCGFESAAPEILRAMNKTSDPSAYLEAAVRSYSSLRRNNIPCSAFLVFGCPRMERIDGKVSYAPETDHDVRTSLEFAIHTLDPDFLSMNVLRLLPGVPFSFAPQFACVRPTGEEPIHGGHYDASWYEENRVSDLRSKHPILRAFEGCGSVNPPQMHPRRCFDILSLAVDMVNTKNSQNGKRQTKIIVDTRFERFLREEWKGGNRYYSLVAFEDIDRIGSKEFDVKGSPLVRLDGPSLINTEVSVPGNLHSSAFR